MLTILHFLVFLIDLLGTFFSFFFAFFYFIDANCIDRIALQQENKSFQRFTLMYLMQSFSLPFRLNIMINAKSDKFPSFSSIFLGANWVERELFELFGLEFINHGDLRRLLLDYGFRGYPLRKDFPITGFNELSFHTESQTVSYGKLILQQEFRNFQTENVWRNYN